ncbi:MAG: hypothetical protein WBS24_12980 [Terriglobales bacterium]
MPSSRTKLSRKQQDKKRQGGRAPAPDNFRLEEFLRAHSSRIVALLCVYAGLRILVFALAFPLFNNVDEQAHLMSIRMYAQGHWPGKDLPLPDAETARLFSLYTAPEYLTTKVQMEEFHLDDPLYHVSRENYPYVASRFRTWLKSPNFEAQSTPLYYLAAAGWYRVGEALGMQGWQLAYWIRLLNPAAYVLLVWASYRFVRIVFPGRMFLWLGVPALLAVFPQDVYFGINRDVFSAPITALTLLWMVKAVEKEHAAWRLAVAALLVALGFLVNVSNCVLYAALAVTLWFWARKSAAKPLAKIAIASGALFASLALPLIWMLHNRAAMGDLTGSRAKIAALGWTMKPVGEIFHHPLFSFGGLFYFLTNLGERFWRGEYVWHLQPMRWPVADWFYLISSVVLVAAFAVQVFRDWKDGTPTQHFAEITAPMLVVTSILFMAAISLPFDFHQCFYPSQEHPFFLSGRIISGALLPFVLMYASGMEFLVKRVGRGASAAAVLLCLMAFITITEFSMREAVFSSPYNYFALRSAAPAFIPPPPTK